MNLLVRTVLGLRRLATPDAGFTFCVLGAVLGVEVLGRHATLDLHDLLALSVLVMLTLLVVARHRRTALPWAAMVGRWLAGVVGGSRG
jgi:hypothetical protein